MRSYSIIQLYVNIFMVCACVYVEQYLVYVCISKLFTVNALFIKFCV